MALKNCKECQHQVSKTAVTCPNCGATLKHKTSPVAYFLLFLIIFGAIGTFGLKSSSSTKPKAGFSMPSIGEDLVTFAEYQKLKNGMSYKEAVQILGEQGEETSRNKIDGIPGVMKSVETVMYSWMNASGSNINAMFQNDRLISKAQFGLK
ncbi:MAG: DUF3862 domain-containing protein [Lentisphaeraceae bacterium]|nr:DUF3862 domain-containing protein [Lentisphaeraceae bacterium]